MRPMKSTGQSDLREGLISMGINSAADLCSSDLGQYPERNEKIVQAAVFDGYTLVWVAGRFGLSSESIRRISAATYRRVVRRHAAMIDSSQEAR